MNDKQNLSVLSSIILFLYLAFYFHFSITQKAEMI